MDRVDRAIRSKIMAAVGRANTGPELKLRSALHTAGLRYRLHDKSLPGTPDLVFPRYGAVIFVHGCYWHRHGCSRSTMPAARRGFWRAKFAANQERDARKEAQLRTLGWRVLRVWECALDGRQAIELAALTKAVRRWLESSSANGDLPSRARSSK